MIFVDVLIFRAVPTLYTYSIPESFDSISIGSVVSVSFGRSTCLGIVTLLKDIGPDKSKPILSLHPKKPVFPSDLIALTLWFSSYYLCTPHKAFQTILGSYTQRKLPEVSYSQTLEPFLTLTEEQSAAFFEISKSFNLFSPFYVHGSTGSGKTELYMHLAKTCIDLDKHVLILVPEIALTPQYTAQFHRRFGSERVSVVHSGLTPKQRDIEWNRAYQGQVSIVIGPRSAVFSPLASIGLIIIDEEHENSYKQDVHPRYLAHTVALKRAEQFSCPLVFGSATPRIDWYQKYPVLSLTHRVFNRAMPTVEIVDMRSFQAAGDFSLFCESLLHLIEDRLSKKEKVILLLNRRGFSPYIVCQSCGRIHACKECGLSFTYHQDRTFRCHRCHIQTPSTLVCSHCKKNRLSFSGTGIQKAELELKRHFPNASLLRLDKDSANTFSKLDAILSEFKDTGDILIGTQMIAKGHHIESVTLVGVLGIDTTLQLPDFSSAERTFQLLTQVAGRSGRGETPGHVVIQTLLPTHYAIVCAQSHDYLGFYQKESQFRELLFYPPYSELLVVIFSGTELSQLQAYCKLYFDWISPLLSSIPDSELQIIEPCPAPIEKIRLHFRYQLIFKTTPTHLLTLKTILSQKSPKIPEGIRVIFDIDPVSLL